MTRELRSLREALTAESGDRGVAGLSVVGRAGAEPHSFWTPEGDEEPAFLVYSVTKTFTAVLVLNLAEEGALDLEEPLARWFPRVDRAARITLRQLLNHTAGIPDYGGLAAYHEAVRSSPEKPWSFERFAAETFEKGLLFEPGQGWAYSNPGYMLVKRIAEEVTGTSYKTLVAERIARPLGLDRTFVAESPADLATLAPGASSLLSAVGKPRDVRIHYHPGWVSHGVVASTASGIARFLDGVLNGRLLSRRSLDQMLELVAVPGAHSSPLRFVQPSYGLGVMADPTSPWGLLAGHNGGGPCYSASAFHAAGPGGMTVCALGAIEEGFSPERVVAGVLEALAVGSTLAQLQEQENAGTSPARSAGDSVPLEPLSG